MNILQMQKKKIRGGEGETYAAFIIFKELQDALITVKKKRKQFSPNVIVQAYSLMQS